MGRGRGRDKTISGDDLKNMSPQERNVAIMRAIRVTGTATVRDKNGNVRYDEPKRAGQYHEEKLS